MSWLLGEQAQVFLACPSFPISKTAILFPVIANTQGKDYVFPLTVTHSCADSLWLPRQ